MPHRTTKVGERRGRSATYADRPTLVEMLEEVLDLSAGLGIVLLPLFLTALPGAILVLPAVLLLAAAAVPVVIGAAILAPPYLIIRFFRRRLRGMS